MSTFFWQHQSTESHLHQELQLRWYWCEYLHCWTIMFSDVKRVLHPPAVSRLQNGEKEKENQKCVGSKKFHTDVRSVQNQLLCYKNCGLLRIHFIHIFTPVNISLMISWHWSKRPSVKNIKTSESQSVPRTTWQNVSNKASCF